MLQDELISVGRELYERGMQTTRSGNISARDGDSFLITRTGTNLGRLAAADLISVALDPAVAIPAGASCEAAVHRAIYNASGAGAVVHAHPPYAIALAHTIRAGGVTPIHNEALVGLKWIPVIDTSVHGREGGEEPRGIAEQLASWCSLIVRGHGAFSTGASLSDALYKMFLLDDVCRISVILQSIRREKEPEFAVAGKPARIKQRRVKSAPAIR
jgi:L-fuculose-phosphate aldolase